jgi:hypothetical protein
MGRYPGGESISEAASPPRNRRNSPAEQTDEAPGLIEKEQVDVERENQIGDRPGIERIEPDDSHEPPAFED